MNQVVAQKIENFFSQYQTFHYRKGHILLHAQEDPEYIFRLVKGKVKQYDISYRGDEVLLNIFKPPAFFPMSGAINKGSNRYFFEAGSDIELQAAPVGDTIALLTSNPDVLYDLLGRVYIGVDGLLGRLGHLMSGTARSRVLYEILVECRRFGETNGEYIAISLNESDIGARAGLARETVSREMHKLKASGLIAIVNNKITVHNLSLLASAAGNEL